MVSSIRKVFVSLIIAVLVVASSLVVTINASAVYIVNAFPSEGVEVKYLPPNPPLWRFFAGLPQPKIVVIDASGKQIAGVIINFYAPKPRAELMYIGSLASRGSAIALPLSFTQILENRLAPAWKRVLGSVEGFRVGIIAFIDVLTPSKKGFNVYTFVKSIPIRLDYVAKGYRIASITIRIDTSKAKPVEVIEKSKAMKIASTCRKSSYLKNIELRNLASTPSEIGKNCVVLFCGFLTCTCYCSKWVLEKTYAHIENALIPVVMARWAKKSGSEPQAISVVSLGFTFSESSLSWLRIYASVKVPGSNEVHMLEWKSFEGGFDFRYGMTFYNKRHSPWAASLRSSFLDDAIVAVGFYGSATLAEFRKYEAYCFCGLLKDECSASDYKPTDVTANMTIMDINVKKENGVWVGEYDFEVDDVLGDGKGLEVYWNLAMEHAEPIRVVGNVRHLYYELPSVKVKESEMGIDIADLILFFLKGKGVSKVIKDFPIDAGIEWESKTTSVSTATIFVDAPFGRHYVAATIYESRDKVFINGKNVPLELAYFDVGVYPS